MRGLFEASCWIKLAGFNMLLVDFFGTWYMLHAVPMYIVDFDDILGCMMVEVVFIRDDLFRM